MRLGAYLSLSVREGGGVVVGGAYSRLGAYSLFLFLGWALIRGGR